MRVSRIITVLSFTTLFIAVPAFAHLDGNEWTKTVGNYIIEIADDEAVIEPGQPVHFDLGLFSPPENTYGERTPAPFDFVQVAVMKENKAMTMKSIDATADQEFTGFDYVFPDRSTDYVLVVRFLQLPKTELAATSVPLSVGAVDAGMSPLTLTLIGSASVIALVVLMIMRRDPPRRSRR